jgi:hypothetical protein
VVLLNLDRFRKVNESLGYLVGDQLLQAVAARLTENIRKTDLIARDGENFERPADTISRFGGDNSPSWQTLPFLKMPPWQRRLLESSGSHTSSTGGLFLPPIGLAVPQNATTLDGMMICAEKGKMRAGRGNARFTPGDESGQHRSLAGKRNAQGARQQKFKRPTSPRSTCPAARFQAWKCWCVASAAWPRPPSSSPLPKKPR